MEQVESALKTKYSDHTKKYARNINLLTTLCDNLENLLIEEKITHKDANRRLKNILSRIEIATVNYTEALKCLKHMYDNEEITLKYFKDRLSSMFSKEDKNHILIQTKINSIYNLMDKLVVKTR